MAYMCVYLCIYMLKRCQKYLEVLYTPIANMGPNRKGKLNKMAKNHLNRRQIVFRNPWVPTKVSFFCLGGLLGQSVDPRLKKKEGLSFG